MKNNIKIVLLSAFFSILFSALSCLTLFYFAPQKFPQYFQNFEKSSPPSNSQQVVEIQASEDDWVTQLVSEKKSAVVSIVISKQIQQYTLNNPFGDFFSGSPFEEYFRNQQQQEDTKPEYQEVGGGTGFFVDSSGLILTNKHVVADEKAQYTVVTDDGKTYPAEVKAVDPYFDLAIVQVIGDHTDFPTLTFGNSSDLKVGQTVLAIGNALAEFSGSVTKGIVSGLDRNTVAADSTGMSERLDNVIQVDVAINPGNSGGPLLNLAGEVVGINTAVANAENVGFALAINDAKQAVESYLSQGLIARPSLGIRYVLLNKQIQEKNKLAYDYGALIVKGGSVGDLAVIPGSPADKAGLEENDIILEVNGEKINEQNPLLTRIQRYKIGDTLTLKVFHDNQEKEVTVVLENLNQ